VPETVTLVSSDKTKAKALERQFLQVPGVTFAGVSILDNVVRVTLGTPHTGLVKEMLPTMLRELMNDPELEGKEPKLALVRGQTRSK